MNKLIIKNKKGTELTEKNWKKGFVEVDEERHWEVGRSAERLANDFSNGIPSSGEKTVRSIISLFLKTDEIVWGDAFIEHGSVFDSYSRPRMQDLAIWGEAAGKSFFLGVEAKVDERFGSKSVAQQKKYVEKLLEEDIVTEADKRLKELCDDFLVNVGKKDYRKIRYQLLYYLAGSFREDPEIIIMPVFTYISEKYDPKKGKRNYDDYKMFMELLGFETVPGMIPGMKSAYKKTISALDKNRKNILNKTVYSCYIEK